MTANDKYSLLNRDNLTQPIHMQLSQKQKNFSDFFFFFFAFSKARLNFKPFQKMDDTDSGCNSEITDS